MHTHTVNSQYEAQHQTVYGMTVVIRSSMSIICVVEGWGEVKRATEMKIWGEVLTVAFSVSSAQSRS